MLLILLVAIPLVAVAAGLAGWVYLVVAFAASPVLGTGGVATLGSPPPEEDSAVTTTSGDDPMDGLLDYAACMREHGIDMPDPVMEDGFVAVGMTDGEMPDFDPFSEEYRAAEEACRDVLPFGDGGVGISTIGG